MLVCVGLNDVESNCKEILACYRFWRENTDTGRSRGSCVTMKNQLDGYTNFYGAPLSGPLPLELLYNGDRGGHIIEVVVIF